jgi:hypothetical protein
MTYHTRNRTTTFKGGDVGFGVPGPDLDFGYYGGDETIVEFIAPGDCQPFTVTKSWYSGGVINKPYPGFGGSWFRNYACDWVRNRDAYARSHLPTSLVVDTEYATHLRARTNPSRSGPTDLGVNLLDMNHKLEVLQTLKAEVDHFKPFARYLRYGSKKYLEYQFMIAPLVTDITKVIAFSDAVQKRVKELERLTGKRGLRRTIDLDANVAQETVYGGLVQSFGTTISAQFTKRTSHVTRGHARWEGGNLSIKSPADRLAIAQRAVYGLAIDPSTAWNILPWSWFVDWFSNAGELIESHRNLLDTRMTVSAIMHDIQTRTNSDWLAPTSSDVVMTPIKVMYKTKSRVLVPDAIEFSMPILNGFHAGILGSITALSRTNKDRWAWRP